MHALFEQVGWLDDGVPGDAALEEVIAAASPRQDESWRRETLARFRAVLASPSVRRLLSRDGREELEVQREMPFVHLRADGWRTGTIDRLVLHRANGRVMRAEVIDFKTDAIGEGGAALLAERYAGQMRAYGAMIRDRYGLDDDTVDLLIVAVGTGEVLRLRPGTGEPASRTVPSDVSGNDGA